MKSSYDILGGNIYKTILWFMFPFLVTSIINSSFSAVDMAIVGHYGMAAGTVGVSMGGRVLKICGYFGQYISVGAQVIIARQLGENRDRNITSAIRSVFTVLLATAGILGVLCFCFSEKLLIWTNTPADALPQAMDYIKISAVGMPLTFGFTCMNCILQAIGKPKLMLATTALSTLINIGLDFLFIAGMQMGAGGAALATVLAQATSFVLVLALFRRIHPSKAASVGNVRLVLIREIIRVASPMVMGSFCVQVSQLFLTGYVNDFGITEAAVWGIAGSLVNYGTIFSMSMRSAGGVLVAQNLGSGNTKRTQELVNAQLVITLIFTAAMSVLCMVFPEEVFRFFTNDPEVAAGSYSFMWIIVLACWLAAFGNCWNTITTGSGHTILTFVAGLVESLILRVALGLFFGAYLGLGAVGYFLGNSLARTGPMAVHGIYFYSGKWKKHVGSIK